MKLLRFLKIKTTIFIAIFTLLFQACTPDPIDLELEKYEPKLVIASQIIPNQVMIVGVSKSFSALSNPDESDTATNTSFVDSLLVSGALVTVSYSGKTDTLHMIEPGIYVSLTTLQLDYGVYNLYVKDPATNMEVTATSVILPKVGFDTISPVLIKNAADTTIKVDYSFTDIPNQENWYMVNFYVKKSGEDSTNFDLNSFSSIGPSKLLSNFELLSDKTFSSISYSNTVTLDEALATDSIAVSISNISEGYFQFLTAYKRSGTIINQLTGEPITYPSNVNNGYGYFATHYPDIRVFDLNKY